MNKSDLLRAVANKEGCPVKDVERVVDALFEVIALSLTLEEDVSIRNFGKFEMRQRREVTRKNPRTGEEIHVPAKRGIGFRAAPRLKDQINRKHHP